MRTKSIAALCLLIAAGASFAGECPASLDWDSAKEVSRGVKYLCVTVDQPRLMANHIVRVDLREPGLRVTGSRRPEKWGQPMPDYTNSVMIIDSRRQRTRDFLDEHRRGGTNMVFALNTSAWIPWEKPHTHKYGSFLKFLVSDGEVVSHTQERGPMLVVFTNNVAVITNRLDDAQVPSVAVAHPGYDTGVIMRGGEPVPPETPQKTPQIAPRTAMGLSADGRWLYALVVDGRQRDYSVGADMSDLARVLKAAGAADAINMDGGGSATLVFWDGTKRKSVIPNRHDSRRNKYRPVAANMGFYLED